MTIPEPVHIPELVSIPEQVTIPEPVSIPEPITATESAHIPELYSSLEPQLEATPDQTEIESLMKFDLPTYTPTVPITTPTPAPAPITFEPYIAQTKKQIITPPPKIVPAPISRVPAPVPISRVPAPAPISRVPAPVIPKKKIVYVPKIKRVIVPKKKIVYVPSKKKVIVQRPSGTVITPPATASYVPPTTASYVPPSTVSYVPPQKVPVPQARPIIPQATLVQRPVPVPVPMAQPPMPIQTQTIPYSQKTLGTTSYRPSLQLPTTNVISSPYGQATYRPHFQTKMGPRPVQMRRIKVPMPVKTISPVAPMPVTIPNVQSYKPAQPLVLPPPVSTPQVIARPPVATVTPLHVPMSQATVTAPIPVQTSTVRPVQVPVPRPVPVQVPVSQIPVPTTTVAPVPVVRPPVATVTPIKVAPNIIGNPLPQMPQLMQQPMIYNANTYRPAVRRNAPMVQHGFNGYRPQAIAPAANMGQPTGYVTRTYKPRRL